MGSASGQSHLSREESLPLQSPRRARGVAEQSRPWGRGPHRPGSRRHQHRLPRSSRPDPPPETHRSPRSRVLCTRSHITHFVRRKIAATPRLGGSSPRTIRGGNSLPASISSTSSAGSWSTPPRSPMHLRGDFDRCANFACPLHTQTCHGLATRGGGASAASVILAPSRASGKATASSENNTESRAHENDLIQPSLAPPEAMRAGEKLLQPPPFVVRFPAPQIVFVL
jgi:hypothetical protein